MQELHHQPTLSVFDPFKGRVDRNYPGLQLEPIERGPKPVCLFFGESVKKDKGGGNYHILSP